MHSREIIHRTLDYDRPKRVGQSFGISDIATCGHTVKTHATDWEKVDENQWRRTDEWGNVWSRLDPTSKGEVSESVLKSVDDAEGYEFPDFSNRGDYEQAAGQGRKYSEKFVLGVLPGFAFNIARKLLKLDEYLMALMLDRARLSKLHDRIDGLCCDMIRNYAAVGVDGIFFCEDWGTQNQTLVSPEIWREEFFPRFRKLCGEAHEAGLKVFMHSCGKITAIIPGLIKAGVDALQFDQPTLHGINTLAELQELGKITFWCPVDIQKTLPLRDEGIIRAQAREMLDKLWEGRGGFMAGYYSSNEAIGLSEEVQGWACDEFVRFGLAERYR